MRAQLNKYLMERLLFLYDLAISTENKGFLAANEARSTNFASVRGAKMVPIVNPT